MKKYYFSLIILTLILTLCAGKEKGIITLIGNGSRYFRAELGQASIWFHEKKTKGVIDYYPLHNLISQKEDKALPLVQFALAKMSHYSTVATVIFCTKPECHERDCEHNQKIKAFYEQNFKAHVTPYRVTEDLRYRLEGIQTYPGFYVRIDPK